MSAYGVRRVDDDRNHHETTTETRPTPEDLCARVRRLADLHESKGRRMGTTLVDYATGGMDAPIEQVTLTADDLRELADLASMPARKWGVYQATVLADYAMRELDNAKLLQEWALEMCSDPELGNLREANRRVAIAQAGLHAAEDELTRAQQRAAKGVAAPPARE